MIAQCNNFDRGHDIYVLYCTPLLFRFLDRAAYKKKRLTDYSQVDMLGPRFKVVNFGAEKSPAEADGRARISR